MYQIWFWNILYKGIFGVSTLGIYLSRIDCIPTHATCHAVAVVHYISIYSNKGPLVFFSRVNHLEGMKGTRSEH